MRFPEGPDRNGLAVLGAAVAVGTVLLLLLLAALGAEGLLSPSLPLAVS